MHIVKNDKKVLLVLIIFILFSLVTRGFNVNWGNPFYFHPDERNIAYAIGQLSLPNQMNPHFFAYGSLPIYTIYFAGILNNWIMQLFTFGQQVATFSIPFTN